MEEQDEKPPEPLKTCAQPESRPEVEGIRVESKSKWHESESLRRGHLPAESEPEEGEEGEEGQVQGGRGASVWERERQMSYPQGRRLARDYHQGRERRCWVTGPSIPDLAMALGRRESTSKQNIFDDEPSRGVKLERLTRDDPWLSSCEEVQDCKGQLEKQQEKQERLLKEMAFTHRKAITYERVHKSDELEKSGLNSSLLSPQMIPIRNHLHKHASHVKKLHYNSIVNTHEMINDSEKLCENNECGNPHQNIHLIQFTRTQTEDKSYGFSDSIQSFSHDVPLNIHQKIHARGRSLDFKECGQVLNHSISRERRSERSARAPCARFFQSSTCVESNSEDRTEHFINQGTPAGHSALHLALGGAPGVRFLRRRLDF
ncbi:hypothetical protein GH733_016961 [Mirounga leonina]|nr:hypothetical protein GH733_016961 [Mirounga leonina]